MKRTTVLLAMAIFFLSLASFANAKGSGGFGNYVRQLEKIAYDSGYAAGRASVQVIVRTSDAQVADVPLLSLALVAVLIFLLGGLNGYLLKKKLEQRIFKRLPL